MPNSIFNNTSDLKTNMVESKNNNSSSKTDSKTNNNNADLKHNNSGLTKNNNSDTKNNNNVDVKTNADSKTNADASAQGDSGSGTLSPHGEGEPSDNQHSLNGNKVYKSGPLFLSSKGIGWTSWKKRWFVLTQTSLVFFRSDPNAASQRGSEVNLTLGGIDLNSSGSVVVKADKKLLTVSFPDGRDGRAFTLKAETTEDLNEWKAALEEALANAPSVSPTVGQTGTLKNDKSDTTDEQSKDRSPVKSKILGCPVLLALEDSDGTPSFLEKALRYVEDHGVKVEGILRQAADVEDVERRFREYEQGKVEFTAEEDAHVIGDCIKYVLRELPSSPVPASCCNALLDAYRTDRATRVSAMRAAICDTFPEPNRRLLQRMLIMMEAVAENKNVNRMSVSAVAACMAPLLLRPLLAGECNLDSQLNMGGDGSAQLMQAAAAANHAQAIVITLLEEYDNIFGEGDMLSDLYSDSEDLGSESEELSEDEIYEEDDFEDGEYTSEGSNSDEDSEHASTSSTHSGDNRENYKENIKKPSTIRSRTISHKVASKKLQPSTHVRSVSEVPDKVPYPVSDFSTRKAVGSPEDENVRVNASRELTDNIHKSSTTGDSHANMQHTQTDAKKELSNVEKEDPEATEEEAKAKKEAEDLLNKKKALETRRLQLEQDVARLEEKLRKELELRRKLETGIKISQQALFSQFSSNDKAESDVISINQKIDDLQAESSNPGIAKDNHDAAATSQESKDTRSRKDGYDKHQFHSFSTRLPPHQHLDPTRSSKETNFNKDSDDKYNLQSHPTKDMKKSSSSKPKRLNSKNETNSAMSKITNGLNFLKERSNQIADELQLMNKDRNKSQRHARRGSQEEFDFQSSKESQPQHLESHTDTDKHHEQR